MKEPTTIPDGVAHNIATSAASLLDDATACIEDPTPQNVADLLASMRIMQHRLAKALQEVEEPSSHTINELKLYGWGDARLMLQFDDDHRPEFHDMVDLSPTLAQGIFEPLRDPAIFQQVTIGPHGRMLVWKFGVDKDDIVLSADALWSMRRPIKSSEEAQ
jgi:hypothetical protein